MRKILFLISLIGFLLGIVPLVMATPMVYDNSIGEYYEAPVGFETVASVTPGLFQFEHEKYFTWGIGDITPNDALTSIRIVFEGINNNPGAQETEPDDVLNVYIFDNVDPDDGYPGVPVPFGLETHTDPDGLFYPNWETQYNATWIDVWSDPTDTKTIKYDVVFEIVDPTLINYIANGNSFGLGLDPDCYYSIDEIRVEAPVPEPATMILLGSGLIGLGLFGRKKLFYKG